MTIICALFQGVPPAPDASLQTKINEAIDRGAAWLRKSQNAAGGWEDGHNARFKNGVVALGFLTLIKSGVGESDPSIQKCLKYFDDYREFDHTYSTGVYLMALEALKRGAVDRPRAEAGAKWLLSHHDKATKLWAYPEENVDLSNTQYALLGLHAAWRMGVEIPRETVFDTINAILKLQTKEGSFVYRDINDIGAGSMTTAGICALRIAAMQLKGFAPADAKKGDWADAERAAFDWLEKHFRVDANPAGYTSKGAMRPWHYYYLYGLERACSMAGKLKLGQHAWYREGAEFLLGAQSPDGSWKSNFTDTCFALLFLKRASLTWSPDSKRDTGDVVGPPANENAALARRPPEPKPDAPFITNWLLCGPFLTKKTDPLSRDEIGEVNIKNAREGDAAGSSSRRWVRAEAKDRTILLDRILPPFDGAFAYAFTTITAKKDREAVLWIGHDDGARVWLNGKLIYENETYGEGAGPDMYFVKIKLKAGANPLLVKVYDAGYDCGLCARITNPDGTPLD